MIVSHQYWNTKSISTCEKPGQVLQQENIPWVNLVWEKQYKNGRDLFGGEMS
jgi:hypothetical protein